MSELPHTTKEKQEELEFAILRGSVPCIPRRTDIATRTHPVPAVWMQLLRNTAASNLFFSLALVVLHLATPLALPLMKLAAVAIHMHGRGQSSKGAPTLFTPLHHYYLSATGSDANDGLAPTVGGGHGPWLTPTHAVVCGDLIEDVSGAYNNIGNDFSDWGIVSGCPSTTGGIDGNGGIYFAAMVCDTPFGCTIDCATGPCNRDSTFGPKAGMSVNRSNWAIIGWYCNGAGNINSDQSCFQSIGPGRTTTYNAFINDISVNAGQAFTTSAGNTTP